MFVLLPSPPRSTPSWLGFVHEPVSVDHKTSLMNAGKKVNILPQVTALQAIG